MEENLKNENQRDIVKAEAERDKVLEGWEARGTLEREARLLW